MKKSLGTIGQKILFTSVLLLVIAILTTGAILSRLYTSESIFQAGYYSTSLVEQIAANLNTRTKEYEDGILSMVQDWRLFEDYFNNSDSLPYYNRRNLASFVNTRNTTQSPIEEIYVLDRYGQITEFCYSTQRFEGKSPTVREKLLETGDDFPWGCEWFVTEDSPDIVYMARRIIHARTLQPQGSIVVGMLKNPLSLPTSLCWENFTEAIEKSKFTLAFCNSLIATICGTLLLVIVCSMAAYVIVRRERSRFYNAWQYIFLAAVMLPFQTVMFPLYKNLVNLHMLNTLWGYVLVSVGFQLGFNIFLYCGFIKTVPLELEEAAQIDGCNAYGTYFKIVFPLLKPITMTVVVLAALGIWNDYQIALVVIMKDNVRTLPVAQQAFIGQQISYHNLAAAACLLSIIPMFLLFLFLQKFIVKGIAAGAVKG